MIQTHTFASRHIGPRPADVDTMLAEVGVPSLDSLVDAVVPAGIRTRRPLSPESVGSGVSEHEVLAELKEIASRNRILKSYIGMGYHGCITPPVILRNLLED